MFLWSIFTGRKSADNLEDESDGHNLHAERQTEQETETLKSLDDNVKTTDESPVSDAAVVTTMSMMDMSGEQEVAPDSTGVAQAREDYLLQKKRDRRRVRRKKNNNKRKQVVRNRVEDKMEEAEQTSGGGTIVKTADVSTASQRLSEVSIMKKNKEGLRTNMAPESLMGNRQSKASLKKKGTVGRGASFDNAEASSNPTSVVISPSTVTSPVGFKTKLYTHQRSDPHVQAAEAETWLGAKFDDAESQTREEDGWKEVTRSGVSSHYKKMIVPSSVISRVIGKGGCNINAIRESTGAFIEVDKLDKGQVQRVRTILIRGSTKATKKAQAMIIALMDEPDNFKQFIPAQNSCSGASVFIAQPNVTTRSGFPMIGSVTSLVQKSGMSQSGNAAKVTSSLSGQGGSRAGKTPVSRIFPSSVLSTKSASRGSSGERRVKGSPTRQRRRGVETRFPTVAKMNSEFPPIKKQAFTSSQQSWRRLTSPSKPVFGPSNSNMSAGTSSNSLAPKPSGNKSSLQSECDVGQQDSIVSSTWDWQLKQRRNVTLAPVRSERMEPTSGMKSSVTAASATSVIPWRIFPHSSGSSIFNHPRGGMDLGYNAIWPKNGYVINQRENFPQLPESARSLPVFGIGGVEFEKDSMPNGHRPIGWERARKKSRESRSGGRALVDASNLSGRGGKYSVFPLQDCMDSTTSSLPVPSPGWSPMGPQKQPWLVGLKLNQSSSVDRSGHFSASQGQVQPLVSHENFLGLEPLQWKKIDGGQQLKAGGNVHSHLHTYNSPYQQPTLSSYGIDQQNPPKVNQESAWDHHLLFEGDGGVSKRSNIKSNPSDSQK